MEDGQSSSVVIRAHLPCPQCGSSDALALYSDGHTHCFANNCHTAPTDGGHAALPSSYQSRNTRRMNPDLLQGEVPAAGLKSRGITADTLARYGYMTGRDDQGRACGIGPVRDATGTIVAQKLRLKDKDNGFPWAGDPKEALLFGSHLGGSGKRCAVTEGFEDAMALSQALGNSWPVFSIINGAKNAKKDIVRSLPLLQGYETVVLFMDEDDAGREAVNEVGRACAHMLNLHVAKLPVKDCCDMLKAGRVEELVNAFWRAGKYQPRGILSGETLRQRIGTKPSVGRPWAWPTLTELTYGRRPGELYTWGAGVGVGKTEVLAHIIKHDVVDLQMPTVLFSSEQSPEEAVVAIAGKLAGRRLHIPDAGWTEEERSDAIDRVLLGNRLFVYDRAEAFDWASIRETLRYLIVSEGVCCATIDNLTAVVAAEADERRSLDLLMKEAAGMAQEYGIFINLVSHLTTPEGKAHEEGGRVLEKQFTGSRAIARWSHFLFGLERDKQAEDPALRSTTTLRILKARPCGWNTGKLLRLKYSEDTGCMTELGESSAPAEDNEF